MSTSGPRPKSKPVQEFGIMRNLRSKTGLYNLDVALSGLAWRCQRLAVLPCLDQQPVDGIGWSGPGKQEPLHLVAAGQPQQNAKRLSISRAVHKDARALQMPE